MTWRIEIPAPCDWINSNHRTHRMEVAKRTALWRRAAFVRAYPDPTRFTGPVRIVATVHKARAGRWDAGNLYPTAKAIVDGLVAADVLYDDSNEYVIGPDMRAGEKRPEACVVITITLDEREAA
jgi:hypothetical protein